jgi:hypothetical protein
MDSVDRLDNEEVLLMAGHTEPSPPLGLTPTSPEARCTAATDQHQTRLKASRPPGTSPSGGAMKLKLIIPCTHEPWHGRTAAMIMRNLFAFKFYLGQMAISEHTTVSCA